MLARLIRNRDGNFSVMTALLLAPIAATVALCMDFFSAIQEKADLQGAMDSAVMAAATSKALTTPELRAISEKVLKGGLSADQWNRLSITEYALGADNRITMKATSTIPTVLLQIANRGDFEVGITSQAVKATDFKIELALVLDNTYSMTGTKLADLKIAANAMVNAFANGDNKNVRYSLVPFSNYVNLGTSSAIRNANWMNVPADTSTTKNVCTTSRPIVSQTCTKSTYTAYNDGVPYTATKTTCTNIVYGDPVTTCKDQTSTSKWYGCVGSRSGTLDQNTDFDATKSTNKWPGLMNQTCGKTLIPLTSDTAVIRTGITAMVANNETYIPAGILWGWQTLTAAAPFSEADPASSSVQKFMVIMTDGQNTLKASGSYHVTGSDKTISPEADALMVTQCNNAKNDGITIFTIAVGISATSTTAQNLAKCASSPEKAILVADSSTLATIFTNIANKIMTARFTM